MVKDKGNDGVLTEMNPFMSTLTFEPKQKRKHIVERYIEYQKKARLRNYGSTESLAAHSTMINNYNTLGSSASKRSLGLPPQVPLDKKKKSV